MKMKMKRQWRALEFFNPILLLVFIFNFAVATAQESNFKTYIVYVKKPDLFTPNSQADNLGTLSSRQNNILDAYYQTFLPHHASILSSTTEGQKHPRMVHAYRNVATGFAARLTAEEAKELAAKDGVVSAQPQKILPLHTTHSPSFLGLRQGVGLWNPSNLGQGVIIGVLDSGVWPNHPSFRDEGVPAPPPKWKGRCDFPGGVCNNKLIGARSFVAGEESKTRSPFDMDGHGTHTTSTAAGNFVKGASYFRNGKGTAVGMAPHAHVAVYQVCGIIGCAEADILAGLDAAVADGVDVISASLGSRGTPFYTDSVSIGSFAAMQRGIFVSCSAGNNGAYHYTVSNEAPWILTVGATTIDRKFKATVKLGTGEELEGETLFQPMNFSSTTMLPLVYDMSSPYCEKGSLRNDVVAGKVVACYRGGSIEEISKGAEVKRAGGAAMILMNEKDTGDSVLAHPHVLPASEVSFAASSKIISYIKSNTTPTATILFQGSVIGDSNSPAVASFSSRGPNSISPGILKPDIVGPGVNILAAWPPALANDSTSNPQFEVISGTSMSCPHLSGIAALLRSSHPDWSPAAIKSAIMTTADVTNLGGKPILDEQSSAADIFAIGAGHVNPSKANDPGLIYDIKPEDYIPYLCGLDNYTDDKVSIITYRSVNCSQVISIAEAQLNYPSFSVVLSSEPQNYTRTVTNVGKANSIYTVEISEPVGTKINVNPPKITFTEVNQKANYTVTFLPVDKAGTGFAQGYLRWVSDNYSVKSPISVVFDGNHKTTASSKSEL